MKIFKTRVFFELSDCGTLFEFLSISYSRRYHGSRFHVGVAAGD